MSKIQLFLRSSTAFYFVTVSILSINILLFITDYRPDSTTQKRKDASGFSMPKAEKFIYFYYYTADFPLATLNSDLKYSEQDAQKEIKENGEDLIMEYEHWSRLGENARIWAFLPDAFISGSPEQPSIRLFNIIIFTLSLIILYIGFWQANLKLYGLLLVILINFTPFYLFEVYTNDNIFALLGSVFFMILGLNIPLIIKSKVTFKRILVVAIISGSIIGLFSELRNEISIVIVSLILIYLISNSLKIYFKIILITLCILSFYGSKQLIQNHFNNKFEETASLVAKHNGHVYSGNRISGHKFWHPVFCGLGDFDTKYGYEWNDKVAYKYATPILQNKYGMDISYSEKYYLDNYYDSDSIYYVKFDEIEAYESIVKDKVISDITNDPFWYIKIITKRIIRTLSITIPFSFVGWFIFYILFLAIKNKKLDYHLKLILVSLPLSATSIIIYSGKGATYNSVFVYFVIISLVFIVFKEVKKQLIE